MLHGYFDYEPTGIAFVTHKLILKEFPAIGEQVHIEGTLGGVGQVVQITWNERHEFVRLNIGGVINQFVLKIKRD